ncbi:MAG: alpha/beta hydrolase [Candidatus Omnitrophota bacterium]
MDIKCGVAVVLIQIAVCIFCRTGFAFQDEDNADDFKKWLNGGNQGKHMIKTVTTKDGNEIYYRHYKNGNHRVIVIAPGFTTSKDSMLIKELGLSLSDEYDVMVMDFRGHGQSKGLFCWTSKEYLDLEAILKKAREEYDKIGVIGFSLGGATAIITASKSSAIDSLISVSAPSAFEKIDYRFWELDVETDILFNLFGKGGTGKGVRPGPFWLKKEKPVDLVRKIKIPILFIHGEDDWLIKPWHCEVLYEKAIAPKGIYIIEGGPHAEYLIRQDKDSFVRQIKKWFTNTLN